MLKPDFPKPTLNDDLKTVEILGTIKILKNRFRSLSTDGKMHFLSGWLNDTAKIAPLNQDEKSTLKRMHQIWQQMLLNVGNNISSRPICDFRHMMEKDLIAQLGRVNFLREKLTYFKQLLKLISKGNGVTAPDPQLVNDVKSIINDLRILRLQSFKNTFARFSISLQQRALKLLSRQHVHSRTRLGSWVQRIHKHFSALTNEKAKELYIDEITTIHRKKLEEFFVERPRKALYTRWTSSLPKTASKGIVGRRLFLPKEAVIDLTKDESEYRTFNL